MRYYKKQVTLCDRRRDLQVEKWKLVVPSPLLLVPTVALVESNFPGVWSAATSKEIKGEADLRAEPAARRLRLRAGKATLQECGAQRQARRLRERPTCVPSPLRQALTAVCGESNSSAVWSAATNKVGAERGTRTPTPFSRLRILSPCSRVRARTLFMRVSACYQQFT